ncbi:MAG: energy-coupling factor ABC transporter permease [Planctomycetia bacterium]|nr:energy-coupling factor ABC transporter permease [Planctomycetia bacterium]
MHMADALISPVVGGTMMAISGGLIAYSVRKIRKNFDESRIPLMGVVGAFVFAAQMINFAIPGTGSSGHIGGAVLLAVLLGAAPAFIVMASVLLVQALFFADGGLLAWGCNLFNMGFFGCFLAYPYIFRPLVGKSKSRVRVFVASIIACLVSLELGAFAVTLETLASGVTELPLNAFLVAMLPIHLAIGLGEGLATGAVLLFVYENLPESETLKLEEKKFSLLNLTWVFGLAAAVLGGGLSLLASEKPDGLEWSMERVAGSSELEATGGVHDAFSRFSEFFAVLPDYAFPGSESWFGTSFSGIVGGVLCVVVLFFLAKIICGRKGNDKELQE